MSTARVNVLLEQREAAALIQMAEAECRHPREQMRYLLREEACRRGLLSKEQQEKQEEEQDGETAVAGR